MYDEGGWNQPLDPSPPPLVGTAGNAYAGPSSAAFVPQDAPAPAPPPPAARPPAPPSSHHLPVAVPAHASTPPSPTRTRSDRPPRPMNAWLLFRTAQLRQMQEDNPGLRKSQGELSKVKQGYEDLARQRKVEHQRIYPDYRYSPAGNPPKKPKASKLKRTASSGTPRATRPHLRLSPSQHAYRPAGYDGEHDTGGADGPGTSASASASASASTSTSTSSSANDSPRYGALPTPTTSSWTAHGGMYAPSDDLSPPPGSAHPLGYDHELVQRFVGAASPRLAPPLSAPPTMAHFPRSFSGSAASGSSALGLSMALPSHHHQQQPPHQPSWLSQLQSGSLAPPTSRHSFSPSSSTATSAAGSYAHSHLHVQSHYMSPPSSATHAPAPYPSSAASSSARAYAPHRASHGDAAAAPAQLPPLAHVYPHAHAQYWTDEAGSSSAAYAHSQQRPFSPSAAHHPLQHGHGHGHGHGQHLGGGGGGGGGEGGGAEAHWQDDPGSQHPQPQSVSPMAVYGGVAVPASGSGAGAGSHQQQQEHRPGQYWSEQRHHHQREADDAPPMGMGGYMDPNSAAVSHHHHHHQQRQQQGDAPSYGYATAAAAALAGVYGEHARPAPSLGGPLQAHMRDASGESDAASYYEHHAR